MNQFKAQIFDIFECDDFFKCSKESLRKWSKIIDWTISESREDKMSEYLNKVVFSGLFVGQGTKNKTRIKAFARVCFIIYSGGKGKDIDKKKIGSLLEKIVAVLKDDDPHPS